MVRHGDHGLTAAEGAQEARRRTPFGIAAGNMTSYPFRPKSNRYLAPGQYLAVPPSDGRFACGRVMASPAFGEKDRVGVVVGLMNWVGDRPPEERHIAGRAVVAQALSRYEAVSNTGGEILGLRPLEADGLVAIDPTDVTVGAKHAVWGWRTIQTRAERSFGVGAA
jgi:hypothetical protein